MWKSRSESESERAIVSGAVAKDQEMPCWSGCQSPAEDGINAAKLLRACGGCLGARRRRRAWKTAISPGELSNEL